MLQDIKERTKMVEYLVCALDEIIEVREQIAPH
jgi:hypothetical protein